MSKQNTEAIPMYEWAVKKKLKIFLESSIGEVKICTLKHSKEGDIYYHPPKTFSEGFFESSQGEHFKFELNESNTHKYISFHASGVIKGPDFNVRDSKYPAFGYRLDCLTRHVELFEIYPTFPSMYEIYQPKDKTQSVICKIPLPSDNVKVPKIFFELVTLKQIKQRKIFKWQKKYLSGFIMKIKDSKRLVLLVGCILEDRPIGDNHVIKSSITA